MKLPDALKRKPVWIAAGFLALVCVLHSARLRYLERLELITYDLRCLAAAKSPAPFATNFGLVEIRDEDIRDVGSGRFGYTNGLLWPRHVYGRAVRELHRQGAKCVAFDVLFSGLRPDHGDSDQFFADQIATAGNVFVAGDATNRIMPADLFRQNAKAVGDISARTDMDGILRVARVFQTNLIWHPAIQNLREDPRIQILLDQAEIRTNEIRFPRPPGLNPDVPNPVVIPVDATGHFELGDLVELPPGAEGRPLAFRAERVWHMGVVIAAHELGLDLNKAVVDLPGGKVTLLGTNGLERVIPVDRDGFFLINWRKTAAAAEVFAEPIGHLLQNDKDQARFKPVTHHEQWRGRLAIIGSTATGNDLVDAGPTPLEGKTWLVAKHWNVANSIINNQFITRSHLPLDWLLICLVGGVCAFLTCRWSPGRAASAVVVCLALYIWLALTLFIQQRLWLPVALPVIGAGFGSFVVELTYLLVFEQQDKKRVKGVFGKIVSPHVVDELLQMDKLALAGTRRELTVMFSDIRGFTELTDVNRDNTEAYIKEHNLTGAEADAAREQSAAETLQTVNRYLSVVAEQVIANEGLVDKFIGDCVMAFWGAPVRNPKHALCAVKAALGAQRAVFDLNREREEENARIDAENLVRVADGQPKLPRRPTLAVGTGLNTGTVTVGLMGWENHLVNYTVFGREVNIASRLEGVSGRSRVIISEATRSQIMEVDPELGATCVRLDPVHVKGIRDDVEIFEVPWRTGKYAPAPTPPPPVVPPPPPPTKLR